MENGKAWPKNCDGNTRSATSKGVYFNSDTQREMWTGMIWRMPEPFDAIKPLVWLMPIAPLDSSSIFLFHSNSHFFFFASPWTKHSNPYITATIPMNAFLPSRFFLFWKFFFTFLITQYFERTDWEDPKGQAYNTASQGVKARKRQ